MKKLLSTTAVGLASALALGAASSADVFVYWDVYKDKDYDIYVDTYKNFDVAINVNFRQHLEGSAQAQAFVNALIEWDASDDGYRYYSSGVDASASTSNSMNYNVGIGQANQDVGNFSNQGNVISAAANLGGDDYINAEAYADQDNLNNRVYTDEYLDYYTNLSASLYNSLNGNLGVFQFNQNAGDGNNQHNVLALAIGGEAVVAVAEAGLSQRTQNNHTWDLASDRSSDISHSVNGNTGLVNVNQATGNLNNQATVYSAAVRVSDATGIMGGP